MSVVCPYCGKDAVLVDSITVYKTKSFGNIYLCKCIKGYAYVGTRKDGSPLGTLAGPELRNLRKMAHFNFDFFWKTKELDLSRSAMYEWLSKVLDIEKNKCHIAMFDDKLCRQVLFVTDKARQDIQAIFYNQN